jgi:hypothetical protein
MAGFAGGGGASGITGAGLLLVSALGARAAA